MKYILNRIASTGHIKDLIILHGVLSLLAVIGMFIFFNMVVMQAVLSFITMLLVASVLPVLGRYLLKRDVITGCHKLL
jgi:hypothetical protein